MGIKYINSPFMLSSVAYISSMEALNNKVSQHVTQSGHKTIDKNLHIYLGNLNNDVVQWFFRIYMHCNTEEKKLI